MCRRKYPSFTHRIDSKNPHHQLKAILNFPPWGFPFVVSDNTNFRPTKNNRVGSPRRLFLPLSTRKNAHGDALRMRHQNRIQSGDSCDDGRWLLKNVTLNTQPPSQPAAHFSLHPPNKPNPIQQLLPLNHHPPNPPPLMLHPIHKLLIAVAFLNSCRTVSRFKPD